MLSPAVISLLPPASHQNMRQATTRCGAMRFRSWRLIALQRRTNRLPGCGARADKSTMVTPDERASAVVRATSPIAKLPSCSRPSTVTRVRADLDCLAGHVSRAKSRPGRRSSAPQRTKFGQSELQSSSARRAPAAKSIISNWPRVRRSEHPIMRRAIVSSASS